MRLPLIGVQHRHADLSAAWLRHYEALGVTDFHVILVESGPQDEVFFEASRGHAVWVRHRVPTLADARTAARAVIEDLSGLWAILVGGDEFVEFADPSVASVVRDMRRVGQRTLRAPLLPRVRADGGIDVDEDLTDPDAAFPLCRPGLAAAIGVDHATSRFPLFPIHAKMSPIADATETPYPGHVEHHLLAVTHHFGWRRPTRESPNSEDDALDAHLRGRHDPLPLDGSFPYSRATLLERGLLRDATPTAMASEVARRVRKRVRKAVRAGLPARALGSAAR